MEEAGGTSGFTGVNDAAAVRWRSATIKKNTSETSDIGTPLPMGMQMAI
jgi:hypothetical protein